MPTDGQAPPSPILPGAELDWTPDGAPRSRRFDDIYFSREGGLDETRAVFLQGCGLPDAWRGRRQFTVGETGFGVGLNVLALLELWRAHRPQGARLSIFSVEAYPLTRDEAARALAAWPQLADLAQSLIDRWPRRAPGFHRVEWPGLGATLDLAVGDVLWALQAWDGRADAWFLDGFSPAKNPLMWRPEVLSALAARSRPGARLGTFTVAGAVRRGLQDAGFTVDKRPGHGTKRQRLEARLPGAGPSPDLAPEVVPEVVIVGAGIAGAALARAFRAQGVDPVVVHDPAAAFASGNPAALVTPALDAGGGPRALFYAQAFARAVDLYRASGPQVVIGQGVERLYKVERDRARFDAVLAGGLFEDGALARTEGGLMIAEGLWIRPSPLIEAWLEGCRLIPAGVAAVEPEAGRWALRDGRGRTICAADVVCIASGADERLPQGLGLAFTPVRGQVSWAEGLALDRARAWGGYAAPIDGGVLFGATHDRDRTDAEVLPEDHARNLATLAEALPGLAAAAAGQALHGRAAVRATTFDNMPAAGPLGAPGLYILGGLGSRGFATAPLLAEHIAAAATASPSPIPLALQALTATLRLRKRRAGPTAC